MTLFFQRGAIDVAHLDLVLRTLPVDISFADEDDLLRYWSGATYRTCDPHYIGRDLRDCHPDDTLDTLEAILAAFKSGGRDVAEGWHTDAKGHFKHTRYFAVRDDHGTYRGILEVNQDLSALRTLEGEQVLPGW